MSEQATQQTEQQQPQQPESKPAESSNEWLDAVKRIKAEREDDRKAREEPKSKVGVANLKQDEDSSESNVEEQEPVQEEAEAKQEEKPEEESSTDKNKKLLKRAETLAKRERELTNRERSLNDEKQEWRLRQSKFADMVADAQKIKHEATNDPLAFLGSVGITPTKLHHILYEKYGNQILEDQLKEEDPNDPKVQLRELKKQLEELKSHNDNGQKEKEQAAEQQKKQQLEQARVRDLELITQWTNEPSKFPFLTSYGEAGFKTLQTECYEYQKIMQLPQLKYEDVLHVASFVEKHFKQRDEIELERISRARGSASPADPKKGKGNAKSPTVEGSDDGRPRGETLGDPSSPRHQNKKPFDREKWAEQWASKL